MSKVRDLKARIQRLRQATNENAKNVVALDAYKSLSSRMAAMLDEAKPEKEYLSALRAVVAVGKFTTYS